MNDASLVRSFTRLSEALGFPVGDVLGALAIVAVRLLPLLLVGQSLFPVRLPAPVTIAVGTALAVALLPAASVPLPHGLNVVVIFRESLVGLLFAVALAVPLAAFRWGGTLIDEWRGIGGPVSLSQSSAPHRNLLALLALALFWAVGGHRLAFEAYADGLLPLPVGEAALDLDSIVFGASRLVAEGLAFAVAIAGPALLALLLYDMGWGLFARSTGAFPATFVSAPLRGLIGTAALALSLPYVLFEGERAIGAVIRVAKELFLAALSP